MIPHEQKKLKQICKMLLKCGKKCVMLNVWKNKKWYTDIL